MLRTADKTSRWFTVASAASLAVFAVAAGAWVWSHVRPTPPRFVGPTPARWREVSLGGGHMAFSATEVFTRPARVGAGYPIGADVDGWHVMGVRWRRESLTLMRPEDRAVAAVLHTSRTVVVWLGLPLLLSAVLPVAWAVRRVKARRPTPAGACRVCGYDLRASAERCPECGMPVGTGDSG
jgi:hypothetical protein